MENKPTMRTYAGFLPHLAILMTLNGLAGAQPVSVGTATASLGQRTTGVIAVPAGVDAAMDIPVIVINGAKLGPKLALLAGAHGTEYASIIALQKLAKTTDPHALSGTLIAVPLLHLPSVLQQVPHV